MQFDFNSLLNHRFVFENEDPDAPKDPGHSKSFLGGKLGRMGALAYYESAAGKKETEEEVSEGTEVTLNEMKKEVEAGAESAEERSKLAPEGPITPKKRESLAKRMTREVYEGDEKLKEEYDKAVKEAIETMGKDKLYDFIFNHTPDRQTYAKGEHEKWNEDFCKLIDDYLKEEFKSKDDPKKRRYIVGSLQSYLVDYFAANFKSANVFEAGKPKRLTNPFIYVDGMMGAYTVSVMAEYWNKKYGKDTPGKTPLENADIDESLAKNKKNRDLYNKALAQLESKLKEAGTVVPKATPGTAVAEGETPAPTPTPAPEAPSLKGKAVELRDKLAAAGASEGALFAFEQAYLGNKNIKGKIKEIIATDEIVKDENGHMVQSPDNWEAVHVVMMSDAEYVDVYNAKSQAPENGTAVAEGETPTAASEEAVVEQAREHYKKGKDLYDNNQYPQALEEFETAYSLKPNPLLLWSIAETKLQNKDYSGAITAYEEFLKNPGKASNEKIKKAESNLARLKAEQGGKTAIASAKPGEKEDEKKEPAISDKLVEDKKGEESLKKEKFVNYFCKMAELKKLDFIGTAVDQPKISEDAMRRKLAEELYGICLSMRLPASKELVDVVIKTIHKPGTDNIEYGPNLAQNRKLIYEIKTVLKKEYLNEVFDKTADILDRDNFSDLIKGFIEKKGIDFEAYGGVDISAKLDFSKRMFDICEKLGLPTNEVTAMEIINILAVETKSGNKIQYSGVPQLTSEEWQIEQVDHVLQDRKMLRKMRDGLVKLHPEIQDKAGVRKLRIAEREERAENEKGIGILAFTDVVMKLIDRPEYDYDFEGVGGSEIGARKAFATEIAEKLIDKKQPLTINIAKRIVEKGLRNVVTGNDDINYYYLPADDEEKAANKAVIDDVLGELTAKEVEGETEKLTDSQFVDKILAIMDSDFDFDFVGTGSSEEESRRVFAGDMLKKCKELGLPLTSKLAEDILLITDYRFVSGLGVDNSTKKDNDFTIYDPSGKNKELNKEVIDTIAYYLAKEYGKSTDFFLNEAPAPKQAKTEVA